MRRLSVLIAILASSVALAACSASDKSAEFPGDDPVELIVPYAAGGGTDIMARSFAQAIEAQFPGGARTVNLAGGGSVDGTRNLVSAKPDGHTVEFSDVGAHIVLPTVGGAPFATDDYVHVARLTTYGFAIGVPVDSEWNDINDLVEHAQGLPDGLKVGTSGALTIDVVAARAFADEVGISVTPVPFASGGEAALAVKSGEIDVNLMSMAAARSARDGDLVRLLATTLPSDQASDGEPTMTDQGIDFTFEAWRGLVLPQGVEEDVVTTWADVVTDLGENEEWLAAVEEQGETWDPLIGAEAQEYVAEYESQLQPILDTLRDG